MSDLVQKKNVARGENLTIYVKAKDRELFRMAQTLSDLGMGQTIVAALEEYVESRGPWHKVLRKAQEPKDE